MNAPNNEDLEVFAKKVLERGRDSKVLRFGEDRAFISSLWREMVRHGETGLSLETFKRRLVDANRLGALSLHRADLVAAMDAATVAASEVAYLNATFHFVAVEPVRDRAAPGHGASPASSTTKRPTKGPAALRWHDQPAPDGAINRWCEFPNGNRARVSQHGRGVWLWCLWLHRESDGQTWNLHQFPGPDPGARREDDLGLRHTEAAAKKAAERAAVKKRSAISPPPRRPFFIDR